MASSSASASASFPESSTRVASTPTDDLIPLKRIARALNLSTATVRAMSKRGDFPPPVNIGARKILFSRYAIDAWYRERVGIPGARFPID
jgi:predicted DNA-binding transcriptional regulator AlpA